MAVQVYATEIKQNTRGYKAFATGVLKFRQSNVAHTCRCVRRLGEEDYRPTGMSTIAVSCPPAVIRNGWKNEIANIFS